MEMLLLDEQCSALIAVQESSLNGLSESSLAHLGERSTEDAKVVLRCCQDYIESFGPALALLLPAVSYQYLVEKKLKYELDGISTTRLMLYHRAEDGKLQEWKDYSTNLKELQRHTQSNGVNPLCIVKPLRRSKELQFPISVILNLHMDSKWLE
ncbi:hypothetical protein SeMB42_g06234 [Synchytrium endobioticum]|uniref:Uncharacterized protein n=1 Tax=Synchytrium endobioticum TaxID=286115 RepID=A0A507CE81_9FUNG|nr:hypothetical protein SeMB42_g06234 [Synchytrium endobioticum]